MALARHPHFYLPDGDLVVCSGPGDNEHSTVFRVNKTVLAYNSPVFQDMFALPSNPSTQEMYEETPMVRVTDSADELEQLIEALYNPGWVRFVIECALYSGAHESTSRSLFVPRWHPDMPLRFSKIMKLATKYQFDSVRKRIVNAMEDSWPRTFPDWLRFKAEAAALEQDYHYDGQRTAAKRLDDCVPEPASAIRFARDFDVPSILPFAFYTLATIDSDADWDAERQKEPEAQQYPKTYCARWALLQPDDYRRLLRGRKAFAYDVSAVVQRYADSDLLANMETSNDCLNGGECFDCLRGIDTIWREGTLSATSNMVCTSAPDPLGLLERLHELAEDDHKSLCDPCLKALRADIRCQQDIVWNDIPGAFRL